MKAATLRHTPFSESVWGTLLAWLLLVSAAIGVAAGLSEAIQGGDMTGFILVSTLSILTGWYCSSLSSGRWWGLILAISLGVLVVWILQAHALANILDLLWKSTLFFGKITPFSSHTLDDQLALANTITNIIASTGGVYLRINVWLKAVIAQTPVVEPVAVNILWGILLWFVFSWSGWSTRRHDQGIITLLPPLILLAGVTGYVRSAPTGIATTLGVLLLVIVFMGHMRNEHRWLMTNFDYSRDIRLDLAMTAIPICIVLAVIASYVPSISIRRIAQNVHQFLEVDNSHPIPESLGLQQQATEDNPVAQQESASLPRIHLLGSGPELSHKIVMEISTNELPSVPDASIFHQSVPSHYWRSMTYDIYTGHGWMSSGTQTTSYNRNELALRNPPATRSSLHQKVTTLENVGGLLYASGEVITVNAPFRVTSRSSEDPFAVTTQAKTYTATSSVINPDPNLLRKVGVTYPDWIKQRYLALPDDLPSRIRVLSLSLVSSSSTQYDRAIAIETYLRTFPYTLDLKAPPPDKDVVDYFLFDLRKGYCDYFASAMVVLARAAGIPARLAVGYASGSYDSINSKYVVSEADAHSWVEIYFPGYGWVEFEPTSGRPELGGNSSGQLMLNGSPTPGFITPTPAAGGLQMSRQLRQQASLIIIFSMILAIGLAGIMWTQRIRYARMPAYKVLGSVYQDLLRYSRTIQVAVEPGNTPFELNQSINIRLNKINEKNWWKSNQLIIQKEVETLISLYVRSIYSPHPVGKEDAYLARRSMQQLQWRFLVVWIINLIGAI